MEEEIEWIGMSVKLQGRGRLEKKKERSAVWNVRAEDVNDSEWAVSDGDGNKEWEEAQE